MDSAAQPEGGRHLWQRPLSRGVAPAVRDGDWLLAADMSLRLVRPGHDDVRFYRDPDGVRCRGITGILDTDAGFLAYNENGRAWLLQCTPKGAGTAEMEAHP